MPNFAAMRAVVFSLSTENLQERISPPPVGARVKKSFGKFELKSRTHDLIGKGHVAYQSIPIISRLNTYMVFLSLYLVLTSITSYYRKTDRDLHDLK